MQEVECQESLQGLYDLLPLPYQSLDVNGCFARVNTQWQHYLGYSPDEVLGRYFGDFLVDEQKTVFHERFQKFKEERTVHGVEFEIWKKDGTRIVAMLYGQFQQGPDGQLLRSHCFLSDVTAYKKEAAEFIKNKLELAHAEKITSTIALVAGIAHEINNPTAYIVSNLTILKEYTAKVSECLQTVYGSCIDARVKSDLMQLGRRLGISSIMNDMPVLINDVLEGAERVKNIVHDLQVLAYPGAERAQEVDINACLDTALETTHNVWGHKATIIREFGTVPLVKIKQQQFLRVFADLFINAAQAIRDQGSITVRTFLHEDQLVIDVEDTGGGIAAEHLSRITDPFFTTKPIGTGKGLGLAIAQSIIKEHNGRIHISSELGKGSQVRILLPYHHECLNQDCA